MNLPKTKQG